MSSLGVGKEGKLPSTFAKPVAARLRAMRESKDCAGRREIKEAFYGHYSALSTLAKPLTRTA